MEVNLNTKEDRKRIIDEINLTENKYRKYESFSKSEIYNGRITPYVNSYLKKFYSTESLDEVPVISSINLCKRIIDTEAGLYKDAPIRTFVGLTETQTKVVKQVYEDMMFNAKMSYINKMFKLNNQIHAQVVLKDGMLHLRQLSAHHLDCIPNFEWPEHAQAFILSNYDRSEIQQAVRPYSDLLNQNIADSDDYKTSKTCVYWSNEYNFVMNYKGEILSKDIENELKMIPIVDIYTQKDFEYWVKQGQTDADFTVQFNAAMTDLAQVMRMQGFSVAYLIASEDLIPESVKIGPNILLKLPINPNNPVTPSFGYANPGADIQGGINYVESLLSAYLTSRGLEPTLVSSSGKSEKFTSGIDRLLAMVDRFVASKSDIENFEAAEKSLFKIIIRYLNTYSGTDLIKYKCPTIDETKASLEIKYIEPEMIQSYSDKLDIIQRRVELGLISKVEAIMEDRGLTEEAALETISKIEENVIEYSKEERKQNNIINESLDESTDENLIKE